MSGVSLFDARTDARRRPAAPVTDETMIADARDGLRPSQMVERKLVSLLKATPLPLSYLPMSGSSRAL